MFRGPLENMSNFNHLHHERRAATFEIVAGANPGKDAIDKPYFGMLSWYKTTRLGKYGYQGDRSQVGDFPPMFGPALKRNVWHSIELHWEHGLVGVPKQDALPSS